MTQETVFDWLMEGDPVIRSQTANTVCGGLASRRQANGRWPVEKRISGVTLFAMEKRGGDSRWNTLRALRVLQSRTHTLQQER